MQQPMQQSFISPLQYDAKNTDQIYRAVVSITEIMYVKHLHILNILKHIYTRIMNNCASLSDWLGIFRAENSIRWSGGICVH